VPDLSDIKIVVPVQHCTPKIDGGLLIRWRPAKANADQSEAYLLVVAQKLVPFPMP
jgi:hypothetical protein